MQAPHVQVPGDGPGMSAAELAQRQRELTVQAALEKLMTLFSHLDARQDYTGRELVRMVIWDLWDLKVAP